MSKIPLRRITTTAALALSLLLVVGCRNNDQAPDTSPSFDRAGHSFREGEKPVYEKTLSVRELEAFQQGGGIVLDVRLVEQIEADPTMIPGSERRDPERIVEWARSYSSGRPIAVYCVKGKWVSQKAAAYLAEQGLDVYSVEGGLEAWKLHSAER